MKRPEYMRIQTAGLITDKDNISPVREEVDEISILTSRKASISEIIIAIADSMIYEIE